MRQDQSLLAEYNPTESNQPPRWAIRSSLFDPRIMSKRAIKQLKHNFRSLKPTLKPKTQDKNNLFQKRSQKNLHDFLRISVGEPSRVILSDVAMRSFAGFKFGKSKPNQDRTFYETKLLAKPDMSLLAVFDGHGTQGHHVARFLVDNLESKSFF